MSLPNAIHGRRYDTGQPVRVFPDNGRIGCIDPLPLSDETAAWPWIAPGLFDLQINGYGGIWFSSSALTADDVVQAVTPYFAHGVTRLCPTLITASFEQLAGGLAAIRAACESDPVMEATIPGIHLEGPYLSAEDGPRGAHPRQHIRPAQWDEFCQLQEIAGGRIRLMTIAPEVEGAIDFIGRATAAGVVIAIGHTAATAEQLDAAVRAGATFSTHLGNAAHPMLRRHPNYIWEQLGDDRLAASLIVDGAHLPSSVVRCMVRAKGPEHVILTCDASGWAGCAPGVYENELGRVEVLSDGRVVVAGQTTLLAGSGVATETCVARLMHDTHLPLATAVDMAGRHASDLLRFERIALESGSRADLIQFDYAAGDERLQIMATWQAGQVVYGGGETPL